MLFGKRLEKKVDALTATLVRIENKLDKIREPKEAAKADTGSPAPVSGADKEKPTASELVNKWRNGEGADAWKM